MEKEIEKFRSEISKTLENSTFIKLTLSNYKGSDDHLQKISVRPIDTRKGARLMFQYRYKNRDQVQNVDVSAGPVEVVRLLISGFRNAHLFAAESDLQLTIGKRSAHITRGKPTFTAPSERTHDRVKASVIDPNAFYLKALGITTDSGKIKADQRDKWKQINKFVEVLAALFQKSAIREKPGIRIVDMGSGKGYLTFAAYDYFQNSLGVSVSMTGVEQRENIAALCEELARSGGFDGLRFAVGSIQDFYPAAVDILIALHACDTATDDALLQGITAGASIIVAAPCCHHELKPQIKSPELLSGILKHPVMLERTAEMITDGIRSLLLEAAGYKTKMFEFVATEHPPKNNLITALKRLEAPDAEHFKTQARNILHSFSIQHQRLADSLLKMS